MIRPPLLPDTTAKSLKDIFKSIRDNLGKKGKAAMKKFITDSGLQEGTDAMKLLRIVFKNPQKDEESGKEADPQDNHY